MTAPHPLLPAVPFLCLLFAAGVVCAAVIPVGSPSVWAAIGMVAAIGGAVGIVASAFRRLRPSGLLVAITVVGLGLWRAATDLQSSARPWSDLPTSPIRLTATVVGPINSRGATASFDARVDRIDRPDSLSLPDGRVRVTVPALPSLEGGDRIEIAGRFDPVDPRSAYGKRLLADGVVATSGFPSIVPLGSSDRPLETAVDRFRSTLQTAIQRMLPEPQAALLAGLLLGSTGGMPDDFRRALVASGTTHIVVVSGYNITLVAGALQGVCRASRPLRMVVPFLGVWVFTMLTGGGAPSVRAAIMATTALLVWSTGRGRDALAALALASAAMLVIEPRVVSDLSFQLSVFATLGLITLQPRVAALAPSWPAVIREPLAATLAAQLATAPLLAATFHQLSLVAPVANALVAPAIPLATIGGAIGVAVAVVVPSLSAAVGALLALPTTYVVLVAQQAAALPHATTPIGDVSPAMVALYAGVLLAWAVAPTPEGRSLVAALRALPVARPAAIAVATFFATTALVLGANATTDPTLTISVLDVGEGDAVLLRTPAQQTVLIDGGRDPAALLNQLGRRLGIVERTLSIAILTAADPERLPGSIAALERYPAGLAISPPEGAPSGLYERWRAAIAGSRQLASEASAAIDLEPGLSVDLIPTAPLSSPARPDGPPLRTLIVRILHGEVTTLMAPSLTPEGARQALAEGWSLSAHALIVPRHGDFTLNRALIGAVDPSLAVISAGARSRQGHPSSQALAALEGIPTYRTDLHGTIEIRSDGRKQWVVTER